MVTATRSGIGSNRKYLRRLEPAIALLVVVAACVGCTGGDAAVPTLGESEQCSAAGVTSQPRADLPAPVLEAAAAISAAATACDFEELGNLASDATLVGFSEASALSIQLSELEAAGEQPMRKLAAVMATRPVRLLDRPTGLMFPAAAAFGNWSEVPEVTRRNLAETFSADDITTFEAEGTYFGIVVAIDHVGDWVRLELRFPQD